MALYTIPCHSILACILPSLSADKSVFHEWRRVLIFAALPRSPCSPTCFFQVPKGMWWGGALGAAVLHTQSESKVRTIFNVLPILFKIVPGGPLLSLIWILALKFPIVSE